MKRLFTTFCALALFTSPSSAGPPNIVFMLVDDMGYADLSCYGAPDVKTPRIDDLAKEGIRFTNFYAMGAECTPSRTAILTGRYPQRAGGMECAIGTGNVGRYDDAIVLAERGDLGLPADQAVLAPALKAAGYTNAVFGKWHLGYEPKFNPLDQGFDEFRGFLGGNVEYFGHFELSELEHVVLNGRDPDKLEGYMTHLITQDSIDFIQRRGKEVPFFLYVGYSTPLFPFQGPDDGELSPHPEDEWTTGTREKYLELIRDMDVNVGQILDALQEQGLAENTIVIFASDHGAMKPGINTPFRDYKGTLFEGGIRVPCIVRWPGKIDPGQESRQHQVGTLMDLTASLIHAAGAKPPVPLDGIDILEHVHSKTGNIERELFWTAKRGERTWTAMRDGNNWKYLRKEEGGETEEWLFDLQADPSESNNLLSENEERQKEMEQAIEAWQAKVKPSRP